MIVMIACKQRAMSAKDQANVGEPPTNNEQRPSISIKYRANIMAS